MLLLEQKPWNMNSITSWTGAMAIGVLVVFHPQNSQAEEFTGTDFLNRSFSNRFWPLMVARRAGIWVLDSIRPLKRLILQLMTGFFGRLPIKAK